MFFKKKKAMINKPTKNKRKYIIMIACGSGICTSTLAESIIEDILNDHNFSYEIRKGSINDVNTNKNLNVDLILTTFKLNRNMINNIPVIEISEVLSGKTGRVEQEIVAVLDSMG